jgi:GNAT superfamily N-acetyltransferase
VANAELTEQKVVRGWPSDVPRMRVRLAVAADVPVLERLVPAAGVDLGEPMADAICSGQMGQAYRAALAGSGAQYGRPAFMRAVAAACTEQGPNGGYVVTSLVLVAEHSDDGVIGAVVALPSPDAAARYVGLVGRNDPEEARDHLIGSAQLALTKVSALAVAQEYRRLGVGAALLSNVTKLGFLVGLFYVYGQMPDRPGLPEFYRRQGFEVYPAGARLDLSITFGMRVGIHADASERLFVRTRRPIQTAYLGDGVTELRPLQEADESAWMTPDPADTSPPWPLPDGAIRT